MTKELGAFEKYLINQDHLDVGDNHKIWFGVFGNPEGIPVVMIHGGPGSQSKTKYLATFDLSKYKIIMIDQRGCGSSLPFGAVENNTIDDLVDDMEKVRQVLNIDKWIISAGSWGAAVALKYAITNADKVKGLFLVSIFLGRKKDVDWLSKTEGAARIFPDVRDKKNQLGKEFGFKHDISAAELLQLITTGDLETQQRVAAYLSYWEDNISFHETGFEYEDPS
jgi:proline iminopeptidase